MMFKVGRLNIDGMFITYAVCPDEFTAHTVCCALNATNLFVYTYVPLNS